MDQVVISYLKEAVGTMLSGTIVAIILFIVLPLIFKRIGKYIGGNTLKNLTLSIETLQNILAKFDKDPLHKDPLEKILDYSHMVVAAAEQYHKITKKTNKDEINKLRKEYAMKYAIELYGEFLKATGEKKEVSENAKRLIDGAIEAAVAVAKKKAIAEKAGKK